MLTLRLALIGLLLTASPSAWAQQDNSGGPMQRKATEASADRLLDDSLLSDKEKRTRAIAKLEQPLPAEQDKSALGEALFERGIAALQ